MIIAEFGYISGPFKGERYTGACGSGGDVRDLVCFAERAGFREAVHMLAEGYSEPHITSPSGWREESFALSSRICARSRTERFSPAARTRDYLFRGHPDVIETIDLSSKLAIITSENENPLWTIAEQIDVLYT